MKLFKGKISVLMPAFNEGHHIYENLRETHKVFSRSKCKFEILLIDDGSSDNTFSEAERALHDLGSIVPVRTESNHGKGNALRKGFAHVTGDYVVFLDADLDLHPKQIHDMLRVMRDQQAHVIVGSKHHPDSKLNYPPLRTVFSKVYAIALKVLFNLPLRDTQTGLKVFQYEVLADIFHRVLCKRYAFDVELLANAHHFGYKIVESPVALDYRSEVKWGRIKPIDVYHMGIDTLAIFYRMHILKYYDHAAPGTETVAESGETVKVMGAGEVSK
ncbi:MAG: glycosyltransferase family 2 protein [Proteobacteria bacterium]|nr:glycosyltransferase family 2 protein [Pseudomonadota bacterium]